MNKKLISLQFLSRHILKVSHNFMQEKVSPTFLSMKLLELIWGSRILKPQNLRILRMQSKSDEKNKSPFKLWNIFSNVTQSPSAGQAAFSSCSLSEGVPGCRLGKSLSTVDTWKLFKKFCEGNERVIDAHQTFFCTRKTRSALAIESFSFSLWSWVNLVASRDSPPPVKLPSMLVCNIKPTNLQAFQITSSDSTSLYFSLRKPRIWFSLTNFFRVSCLSFLH